MASSIGRCSKHRKVSEFEVGNRVRVVCIGGRKFERCNHLDEIGTINQINNDPTFYYGSENQKRWGGVVSVQFEGCAGHYFSPRALEKV
jgi:hypothetical protein